MLWGGSWLSHEGFGIDPDSGSVPEIFRTESRCPRGGRGCCFMIDSGSIPQDRSHLFAGIAPSAWGEAAGLAGSCVVLI